MALDIAVHRDLLHYEKKIGRSLTLRTAAFAVGALAAGSAVGATCWFVLGISWPAAQLAVLAATVPLWALGFARPAGMKPEQWWPYGRRALFGRSRIDYTTGGRMPGAPRFGRKGGEWDVLQKEWQRAAKRVRGVELWDPAAAGRRL